MNIEIKNITELCLLKEVFIEFDDNTNNNHKNQKFIVADVLGDYGLRKKVFRAYDKCPSHKVAVYRLGEEAKGMEVECLGGGTIHLNKKDKALTIESSSDTYGKERDRDQTVALLEKNLPDFRVFGER